MKSREFSQKLGQMTSFKVVDFLDAAIKLESKGLDVIRMEAGQPVFPLPPAVADAVAGASVSTSNLYTPALGRADLRARLGDFIRHRYQVDIDPRRILITTGSSAALGMICDLLINPGDTMLLPDPGYPCNANFVLRSNGTPIYIPVTAEENYQLTAEKVGQYWQDSTVGVMVASPSNPTGDTLSATALRDIYQVAQARGGYLIADEIYHGLNYSNEGDISALNHCERAFVINSFSKYFGLPGWRLGWCVVPEEAVVHIETMAQNFFISPPNISQQVALAALEPECIAIYESRREDFRRRRDFLVPALKELGFTIDHAPSGAFYIYAGIENLADDSEAFCWEMLERAHVAFTPGSDFGSYRARQHVRFSYTEPLERLQIAVQRLSRALENRA